MKLKISYTFLLLFMVSFTALSQENSTISGYVRDAKSQEVVLFAKIYFPELKTGVMSNEYGFFSIEIPRKSEYEVQVTSADFPLLTDTISGLRTQTIDFSLGGESGVNEIEEVVVTAKSKSDGQENISSTDISLVKISIEEAKLLPAIGGETDVLKVAQLMPGINRGSEGGTNFFVRGGDGDQNLILVDEATVYNPGHLFGFFSVFNPDVIKEMSIYKGGFPANYSGRLSSITDIRTIDGDKNKFHATGGIGMLSSRLTLEGPIWKDKMSFMISGRRSYIDQVLKLVGQNVPFYFYDLNAKINYNIGPKDRLFISSYFGNDVLDVSSNEDSLSGNFGFKLGNFTQTVRWTHVFNPKLFSYLSLIHTRFKYDIEGNGFGSSLLVRSAIRDIGLKYDFQYFRSSELKILYGVQVTNHNFKPSVINTTGEISDYLKDKDAKLITTFETNAYADVRYDITSRWKIQAGLSLPTSITAKKTYLGISPRVNTTFIVNENQSFKASISRMYQFMHRVSSSSFALPTDLWYPVSENVKPQIADQAAVSYNFYFPRLKSSLVIEGYYKYMQNLTEYKEGSQIILNDDFEQYLIQGTGWAAGTEVMFRREKGRVTGWVAYTLSWTKRHFDELNGGEAFWAKYDRRHYLTTVGIIEINKRLSFSAIFELASGARFTPIVGQYFQPNAGLTDVEIIPIYSKRNAYRLSMSHRLDINFVIKSKPKKNPRFSSEWHIGAYNVYNRATPFRIKLEPTADGKYEYTQPGLFGFIPSIGYNFKF